MAVVNWGPVQGGTASRSMTTRDRQINTDETLFFMATTTMLKIVRDFNKRDVIEYFGTPREHTQSDE